jgi:hypothetical protein
MSDGVLDGDECNRQMDVPNSFLFHSHQCSGIRAKNGTIARSSAPYIGHHCRLRIARATSSFAAAIGANAMSVAGSCDAKLDCRGHFLEQEEEFSTAVRFHEI